MSAKMVVLHTVAKEFTDRKIWTMPSKQPQIKSGAEIGNVKCTSCRVAQ